MTMVVDGGCPVDVGLSWMGWLVKEDEFKSFIEDSPVNGASSTVTAVVNATIDG
jgi:hypothetical protein